MKVLKYYQRHLDACFVWSSTCKWIWRVVAELSWTFTRPGPTWTNMTMNVLGMKPPLRGPGASFHRVGCDLGDVPRRRLTLYPGPPHAASFADGRRNVAPTVQRNLLESLREAPATQQGEPPHLEQEVTCQLARIAASILDVRQASARIASKVRKLVDFDATAINTIDETAGTFSPVYLSRDLVTPSARAGGWPCRARPLGTWPSPNVAWSAKTWPAPLRSGGNSISWERSSAAE